MTQTQQRKVIASYGLSNTASLNIYGTIHDIDDYVLVGMNDEKPRKRKVCYLNSGRSYFWYGGNRYYLDECIKVKEGKNHGG